jgi:DNA repair exonuclease SbcCD ATPase subunit
VPKAIPDPEPRRDGGDQPSPPGGAKHPLPDGADNPERLLAENQELREIIADLQNLVEESQGQTREARAERQAEYESLLEEKSETIRGLHLKVQELQERASAPPLPDEQELRALSEDLERERSQLQQERRDLEELRRQLADDEKAMTQQMREMEVQMARERAELARQRIDLQRLQDEINAELERAARDNGLNERLGQLRQRYQDVATRKGASPLSQPPSPGREAPPSAADRNDDAGAKKPKDGNLFRRFFRQG